MSTFDDLFTHENKGNLEYNTWAMVRALCAVADEIRGLKDAYLSVVEANEAAIETEEQDRREFQTKTFERFADTIAERLLTPYPGPGLGTATLDAVGALTTELPKEPAE